MREHRRLGGVDAVHAYLARLDALEQRAHAVDVERLVQRVGDRLAHEHVVGDLDRADGFSWHAAACGNTAAMRSSASMRWIGGGFFRPLRNRSTSSDRLRFQRHRARNIGESRMACSACPRPCGS